MLKYLLLIALLAILSSSIYMAKNNRSAAMPVAPEIRATGAISPSPSSQISPIIPAIALNSDVSFIMFTSEAAAQALVLEHKRDVIYFFDSQKDITSGAIRTRLQDAESLSRLKKGTVVIRVSYDTNLQLNQKYAIAKPNAFVRIDAAGKATKQAVLASYDELLRF